MHIPKKNRTAKVADIKELAVVVQQHPKLLFGGEDGFQAINQEERCVASSSVDLSTKSPYDMRELSDPTDAVLLEGVIDPRLEPIEDEAVGSLGLAIGAWMCY